MYDSVREELALKISPIAKSVTGELKEKPVISITPVLPAPAIESPKTIAAENEIDAEKTFGKEEIFSEEIEEIPVKKSQTTELLVKPTSPTLKEFNNRNAMLPDWRLQVQNAVVKRRGGREIAPEPVKSPSAASSGRRSVVTKGATALQVKPENAPVSTPAAQTETAIERALRRIEESRQKYLVAEEIQPKTPAGESSVKYFPDVMQNRAQESAANENPARAVSGFSVKPNVTPIKTLKSELKAEKFDTNKLPPLSEEVVSSFENRSVVHADLNADIEEESFVSRRTANEAGDARVNSEEEIDDCAPLSLRFNAAIFDLLIGSFLSLLLLAPFMLLNGKFFSTEGFLAFLATCAIVMFVYMTASIGFLGRTFGMKLFSLEIVDIDENAYPTLHQAAVSSSLYLVSLALGGLGFLTLFLNNEKRAAHDLLSGTIIVKEY